MTAECVSQAVSLPVEHEPLLRERNLGDLRGTAYDDLAENPFAPDYAPPGGETWEQFHDRVDAAWHLVCELAGALDGHLAVVTHGLVCHSIAVRHIELPRGAPRTGMNGPPIPFGNTALTIVDGPSPWRVELFACTAHLNDANDDMGDGTAGISGI